jgi:mono/diheme cytochrome c family protein
MASEEQVQHAMAIEVGADLYEFHCRSCHGANGGGLGELGPPLNDEHFFTERLDEVGWQGTLEEYIIASTTTGRLVASRPLYAGDGVAAAMNPWSRDFGGPLREDQIHDLAAFITNYEATALGEVELQEIEIPKASKDDPKAVARGEQVFFDGGCAFCHTIGDLNVSGVGPDLTHIASVAATRKPELTAEDYIRESFLIPHEYIVEGYEPEVVGAECGGILSEPQLDDLVAFLLNQE